eukprot:GHVU01081883.1.p1 GENE.GHVU01081883.1~~GHVU01081883.1.p1  ORF type:complete len:201 (-),score=10.57 GHVU01081883.1:3-605(-)
MDTHAQTDRHRDMQTHEHTHLYTGTPTPANAHAHPCQHTRCCITCQRADTHQPADAAKQDLPALSRPAATDRRLPPRTEHRAGGSPHAHNTSMLPIHLHIGVMDTRTHPHASDLRPTERPAGSESTLKPRHGQAQPPPPHHLPTRYYSVTLRRQTHFLEERHGVMCRNPLASSPNRLLCTALWCTDRYTISLNDMKQVTQ